MCLLFSFLTASVIFNLFSKGLHWILISYLGWVLVHYLNNFIVVFIATKVINETKHARITYNQVVNLLGISRNDLKDIESILIIVFEIEIDTKNFIARILNNKLEKAGRAISKVLIKQLVTFFNIQLLVEFLSFCLHAVRLGKVFIKKL